MILKASKGTMKATDLLNGPLLNKIFTEINNIPNNDILRIYCLYFQVINHKNAKNYPWNKAVFWENTCNYFMKENNGKTGQLLAKNVKEDIEDIVADVFLSFFNHLDSISLDGSIKYYLTTTATSVSS